MANKPFVRTPYNYDRASRVTALVSDEETLTKQEFKDECDINSILRRFNVTGELPQGVRMPSYGDFTDVTDFHEAANAIAVARESFSAMPADVRTRFHNDPGEFVDFCSDPDNLAEARKLGLVPASEFPVDLPASPGVSPGPASASGPGGDPAVPGASAPSSSTLPT